MNENNNDFNNDNENRTPPQMSIDEYFRIKYSQLGGWLLFIVVVGWIGIFFMSISQIINLTTILDNTNEQFGTDAVLQLIAVFIAIIALVIYTLQYLSISRRNHKFLRFYQVGYGIMMLSNMATYAARIYQGEMTASSLIYLLLFAPIGPMLFTLYFCRSVRVRTYMGGTEYMDRAIFAFRGSAL
ncbi:MAG: DUF2569 family protein [Oscillospiraceae bacterium]|nr:DUF2569 family protein [Oscillospiraceae bacterium]